MTLRNTKKLWYILQHTNKGIGHNVSHLTFDFIINLFSFTKNLIMVEELASGIVQAAKMMEEQTLDPNKEYTTVTYVPDYCEYQFSHYSLKGKRADNIADVIGDLTRNGFTKAETELSALFNGIRPDKYVPKCIIFSRRRK